jgi:hypothetical protein
LCSLGGVSEIEQVITSLKDENQVEKMRHENKKFKFKEET